MPLLRQWLDEDEQQPPKQRRTARQLWRQLVEQHGYAGGESTVRLRVAELRRGRRPVFVPLLFAPGERAEVDWGEARVVLAGQVVAVHLFCARLRYSNLPFVMAFPHQQQEAFFEGHRRAFEYWGAVPTTVVYDNLGTAVAKVLAGHDRQQQAAFVGLRSTYLFEAVFCNVASGHEKGNVERLVGTVRRQALSPMPEVADWDELNGRLLAWCERQKGHTVPGQVGTVGERWAEERRRMRPLPPRPFDGARQLAVKATRTAEVSFATNRYSVPVAYAYQPLTLKVGVHTVRIYYQATLVAEHARCYGRHQRVSDWRHYLPVLAQKPAAVPFAAALRDGALPPAFERFRQGLVARHPDGNRAFVRVLELALLHPLDLVGRAVAEAAERGAFQVEAVQQVLARLATPPATPPPLDLARYPTLPRVDLAPVAVAAYDQLLPAPRRRAVGS
jgi:transposase